MPISSREATLKKAKTLEALREEISRIEGFKTAAGKMSMSFGIPEIDRLLPGDSFPLGTTHEFISTSKEDTSSTMSFIAALLSKVENRTGPVVWVSKSQQLFVRGLLSFGLDPDRIICVQVRKEQQALWAIEEALRCNYLLAVVGEINDADLTATKRLQLAVEKSRTTGLLLRINPKIEQPSACVTRWAVKPVPMKTKTTCPASASQAGMPS